MDMAKPKIRFNGYTEDWEQRKVKDISDFIDGNYGEKYPRDEEFIDSGIPFFTSAVTGSEGIFNEKNVKYISTEKNRELTKAQSQGGDLILTNRGASMGVIAEIPEKYGLVNIGPQLTRIRGKEKEANNKYLLYLFQTSINNKKLTSMNAGSAMPFIGLKGLGDIDLLIPQYDEQLKIGEYFSCLDHLITLHQRKCEQTKTLKKYMLQKMFPQDGEKVPQIRFVGFTEDWEQRKLNEIADKVSEKNKNNEFSEPFTNSAEQGIISQKDYFDREIVNNENLNGYYIVRNDDFIYNPRISVTAPVGPINRNRLGRNGVMSPLYTVFRTHDIDNLYLEFYFKTTRWHRFMKLNGDSGARFDRFTISSTQFMEMPIPYPTLEEQQKIGEYFESLDHLITLHLRKQDKRKKGTKNT